jgi:hypothetical protein
VSWRLRLIHWLARRLAARGSAKWIHLNDRLYLERYVLRGGVDQDGNKINVYLHRFHQPDDDRGPHNHPWRWSFSLILAGGYRETRVHERAVFAGCSVTTYYFPGNVNWIDESDFHRVNKLLPGKDGEVWTLFVTGPKHQRGWGFLIDWVFKPKKSCGGCQGCRYGATECETK